MNNTHTRTHARASAHTHTYKNSPALFLKLKSKFVSLQYSRTSLHCSNYTFHACHNAGKQLMIKRIVNKYALQPQFPLKMAEAYKYAIKSTQ
jgi:hypothetical protein